MAAPETLGGFLARCSDLHDQLRDVAFALEQSSAPSSSASPSTFVDGGQAAAQALHANALEKVASARSLIDTTLDVVRKSLLGSGAASAAAAYAEGEEEKGPVRAAIPAASSAWFAALQEDLMRLLVKAAVVGADVKMRAPPEGGSAAAAEANNTTTTQLLTTTATAATPQPPQQQPQGGAKPAAAAAPSPRAAALTDGFWHDMLLLHTQSPTGHPNGHLHIPPSHTPASWPHPEPAPWQLVRVITAARECERSPAFLAEHAAEVEALQRSGQYAYPRGTFSLGDGDGGDMPYTAFLRLTQAPAVGAQLARIAAAQAQQAGAEAGAERSALRDVLVLGSGGGLLPYFFALTHGLRAVGVDIVPLMVHTARVVGLSAGVAVAAGDRDELPPESSSGVGAGAGGKPLVRFLHGDAATVDPLLFRGAGLVVVAGDTWDVPLRRAVYARLVSQLPAGALIVDTSDPTGVLWGRGGGGGGGGEGKGAGASGAASLPSGSKRLVVVPAALTPAQLIAQQRERSAAAASAAAEGGRVVAPPPSSRMYEVRDARSVEVVRVDVAWGGKASHALHLSRVSVDVWPEEVVLAAAGPRGRAAAIANGAVPVSIPGPGAEARDV
jgi:SAM-dependent methyltransferase